VKSGKTFSDEGIQGRIDDARNYLMLGRAIFMEKHQIQVDAPPTHYPYHTVSVNLPWSLKNGAIPRGTIVPEPKHPFKTPFLYEGLKNQIRDQKLDAEIKDLTDIENDNFLKGFKKDG